jgi:WD40 repeat protein
MRTYTLTALAVLLAGLTAQGDGDEPRPKSFTGGHQKRVEAVAFSPDGRFLVSGSSYDGRRSVGNLLVWDVAEGNIQDHLRRKSWKPWYSEVHAVAFTPDGKRIAATGGELYHGAVGVWDLESGDQLWEATDIAPTTFVPLAFSPDGKLLATAAGDRNRSGRVRFWDAGTGEAKQTWDGNGKDVSAVAFAPDGNTIASADVSGKVLIRAAADGAVKQEFRHDTSGKEESMFVRLAFAPDGKTLATAGGTFPVRVWDVARGKLLREWPIGAGSAMSLAFAPDGSGVVMGQWGGAVTFWDVATNGARKLLDDKAGVSGAAAFMPDGKTVAIGMADGTIRMQPLGGCPRR